MDIEQARAAAASGRLPAGIYSDPGVHQLERDRLFSRTWQFLAHESEIPEPGDYVVRRIVDDSFIVVRDESIATGRSGPRTSAATRTTPPTPT